MARKQQALDIFFTAAARADLVGIWHWNATEYNIRRADSYVAFIEAEIQMLANEPSRGFAVEEYPGLQRHLAKRKSRGRGHIVFYRVTGERLEVIHIYHTSQDWQTTLGR